MCTISSHAMLTPFHQSGDSATLRLALSTDLAHMLTIPGHLQMKHCHLKTAEALLLVDWVLPDPEWCCLMRDQPLEHLGLMQQLLLALAAADANVGDALTAARPGAAACPAVDAGPALTA